MICQTNFNYLKSLTTNNVVFKKHLLDMITMLHRVHVTFNVLYVLFKLLQHCKIYYERNYLLILL